MFIRTARYVGHPLLGFLLTFVVFAATAYAVSRTRFVNSALHLGAHIVLPMDPMIAETEPWY